jgi:two-component system cell cycle response regulator
MDASILVVGGNTFLDVLDQFLQGLTDLSTEVAPNPAEALPLIQAQQPDILLIQADAHGAFDLCQQVKSQSRLAWIYCILVKAEPFQVSGPISQDEAEANFCIQGLASGADACLALVAQVTAVPAMVEGPEPKAQATKALDWQLRLLEAHVQVGLRQVKNHRELMRTNDLLSAIALSDPLTELNNRRAFEWELPRQLQNSRSRNMPVSLIMLDVDFFKNINDTYGHLVGDRALQLLSARLRHNLRFYDTPFRYGGEEFVIILSDTGGQEASLIAHRICRLVGEQPFVISNELELTITVSAGTASLRPEDDAKGISLLDRADRNLLKAKSQGRNRVISDQEDSH